MTRGCVLSLALLALAGASPARADADVAAEAARALEAEHAEPGADRTLAAARALWRAGQVSSASRRYLTVLLGRPGSAVAAESAERLLARPGLPVEAERFPSLLGEALTILAPAARTRLTQAAAMELIRRGARAAAEQALGSVADHAPARYLRAVLRLARGDRQGARVDLVEAQRLAKDPPTRDLATLGLARLAAEAGDLAKAAALYASVSPSSPSFFVAHQEQAWLELQRQRPDQALAQSAVLAAPAWRRFHRPDRELVEAAALLALCRDRAARVRAQLGRRRLAALTAELSIFLRERPDLRLYYTEAVASAAGHGPLSGELAVSVLVDAGFHRVFQLVRQLQRERRLLLGPEARRLRDLLGPELDARLVAAQRRAGEVVQRSLLSLRTELAELSLRLDEVLFDLESRGERALIRQRSGHDGRRVGPSRSIAPGRQQRWPFQGEYWLDEQQDFVVRLPSLCGSP